MKKFFFSLNTVLNYKEQVLESLRNEHLKVLVQIRKCEDAIEQLEQQYNSYVDQAEKEKKSGISVSELKIYEGYLESLGVRILKEREHLEALRKAEEEKRAQVVHAKQESASIHKLKEKKHQEYNKQEQKEQELFIEEFVSTRNAMLKLNG